MKLLDYSVLFWIILIAVFLPSTLAEQQNMAYAVHEIQYNQKMDCAIDDMLFALVEKDDYQQIQSNREECIQTFYRSFYGNFGFSDDFIGQQRIRKHLPLIGLVELDRFVIAFQKPIEQEKEMVLTDCWTEEKFFEREENGYRFRFYVGALRDWIQICPKGEVDFEKGMRTDLATNYTEITWLKDETEFHKIRQNTITSILKSEMQKVVQHHNFIGKQYGIQYEFYLPEQEGQDWCRNVDDIGVMVLFQGYPVTSAVGYTYQRFVYSGARTYKK